MAGGLELGVDELLEREQGLATWGAFPPPDEAWCQQK
jgi:hypothetical protein